ncbi:MAG: glucose-6-phosphate dehydrogenase, partial [Burkholderiales bacterium]
MTAPVSDTVVLFGASGDLAYKKLFPALAGLTARGLLNGPVIGVARSEWNTERFREQAAASIKAHGRFESSAFEKLATRMTYVQGDYQDAELFQRLGKALGEARRPLFYLAIPPNAFGTVMKGLARLPCSKDGRFVIEKPFGRDLASAQALNRTLC